jgi:acyl-coenzyme A synthetase/AMP-(fatty) acid ligase
MKELIKVRGYQVAPAELEALLLTHPQLSDAAVVPVPDEYSDQLPRAYVTLKEGVNPEDCKEEDVKEWVKERVAAYKRLEGGVKFIEKVPKSASGKILRRILVDQVKAELEEKKE